MGAKRIAIIGCGNLGQSILRGLIDEPSIQNQDIYATKRNIEALEPFRTKGVQVGSNNSKAIAESEIILLGLKPYTVLETLRSLKKDISAEGHIIVSMATGISLDQLHAELGENQRIIRAMPNTGADVGESLTCIASRSIAAQDRQAVNELFQSIGKTIEIDESLMEAATVLGACGIAYVLRFMRAMVQGGIEIGFDAETASNIVNQTVKGASELLIQRGSHPEAEIDKVTTPMGCTIAGLNHMEQHGFSASLIQGIRASHQKINE